MRIDAHQHYWLYNEQEFGWLDDSMAKLRRDFLPADVKPELDSLGYEGCVAVQARESLHENTFLLDLADRFSFIRGVVGWVDVASDACQIQLENFTTRKKLVGVRAIAQGQEEGFFLRPSFLEGIALLESFSMTYDILIFPNQLVEATQFVRRFSNQPFVLDHMAKPEIRKKQREPWASGIKELAKAENVWCKVSGLVTEADLRFWSSDDLRFYVDTVLEAFGPKRLMIGSDWPVCLAAGEYQTVIQAQETLVANLSAAEQALVLGENARGFYRLG